MARKALIAVFIFLVMFYAGHSHAENEGFFQRTMKKWGKGTKAETAKKEPVNSQAKSAAASTAAAANTATTAQNTVASAGSDGVTVNTSDESAEKPTREEMNAEILDSLDIYDRDLTERVPGITIKRAEDGKAEYFVKTKDGDKPLAELNEDELFGLYVKVSRASTMLHMEEIQRQLDLVRETNKINRAPSIPQTPPVAPSVPRTSAPEAPKVPTVPYVPGNVTAQSGAPRVPNAAPSIPSVPKVPRTENK